jgi:hypothetical protein
MAGDSRLPLFSANFLSEALGAGPARVWASYRHNLAKAATRLWDSAWFSDLLNTAPDDEEIDQIQFARNRRHYRFNEVGWKEKSNTFQV